MEYNTGMKNENVYHKHKQQNVYSFIYTKDVFQSLQF